ncbi:MAG: NYN domain-containing protein [Proteobacteria bacterium]|nr:NYN domain-containing protein [Pseudomonadota bacterium]
MRVALFADVQNIYYTTRQTFGRQFNYRALWEAIEKRAEIVTAIVYATDRGDSSQQRFQSALRHIGFEVKLKPFIQRSDGSAKGDWDVGITIDVLEYAAQVDRVILLSGDGDFAILLQTIAAKWGVESEVFGVRALTADALVQAATEFHPIDESLLI